MTRLLLTAIAESQGASGLVLSALLAPAVPLAWALDRLAELASSRWWSAHLGLCQARCPRGHVVELGPASWECAACKLSFDGHAFEPCPYCSSIAYAVLCACSLPVLNPLWDGDNGD